MLSSVFEDLLTIITGRGGSGAVRRATGQGDISRSRLRSDVLGVATNLPAAAHDGVWVGVRDPYLTLVSTAGCLHAASVALVEADDPADHYDTLAGVCPPALVVCDDSGSSVARWARATGRPVWLADVDAGRHAISTSGRSDVLLRFFTSGTTGTPKCVGIRGDQLLAAVNGVVSRLELSPQDTSLGVAPLTHTLGMVTTVLAALAAGGSVTFADPRRPRDFLSRLAEVRPTWCAASPSAHQIAHRLISRADASWSGLRFLRASSAPVDGELPRRLEDYYGVPFINAYAMTEAPGEIASQPLDGERRAGTVGRPTLCDVDIRSSSGSHSPTGERLGGEVWIRGPNVVTDQSAEWLRTGDVATVDAYGCLRLTGRIDDVINHGGLKVWPPDVEAVALADPVVHAAVAFPIPHEGLGATVGLVVVPRPGRAVDERALRRRLMEALPRHTWPGTIVVCAEVPRSARGKIQRRGLWQRLPGIRARVDT
jgi:acyl-CoA synthetase (AMP-forming)/AMP-acid ligase II